MQKKKETFFLGLFFFLGLISILGWTFFFSPTSGDNKKKLKVWSVDIQGILPGTQVTLSGKNIGKVFKINSLLDSQNQLKKDDFGRYYAYELILKVDSLVKIFEGDVITISSSGLVGDRVVNIIPKGIRDISNEISNEILLASSTNIFQEIFEISSHAKSMLSKLTNEIEECSSSLKTTLLTVNELGNNLKKTFILKEIEKTNILLNENLFKFSKILRDNEETIKQLICNSSDLVSDIHNYGLFFQYSKAWKKKEKFLSLKKQELILFNENSQ